MQEFDAQRERLAARAGPAAPRASTSGSTGRAKEVPYPARRIRAAKWAYVDAYCRMVRGLGLSRSTLYVFRALASTDETSLTSLMMAERGDPPRLSLLQAPYRLHHTQAFAALAQRYGPTATRAVVLAAADPAVLYATNPSTLAAFFDRLTELWPAVRELAAAPPALLDRVRSPGAAQRLRLLAEAAEPPPTERWLPGLQAWSTWDGGYVAPYLRRLRQGPLPTERFRHVPMYSMSTEAIETLPVYAGGTLQGFLPVAPGVLYELKPVDGGALRRPWEAEPGAEYVLIVSDVWGLRRYDTADVFVCRALVDGLPDLRFVRRQGLAWSFTGEKLTGEHARLAVERLGAQVPITLIPSAPAEVSPHYRAVSATGLAPADLDRLDEALGDLNGEYADKRRSGRLGPLRSGVLSIDELARAASGESWETQSKVLPLLPRTWEELFP